MQIQMVGREKSKCRSSARNPFIVRGARRAREATLLRSQLDSIDLLWDRRTQLAKTGIGNTYDDWAEGEEAPDMVQADLEVRAIPAPW